MIHIIDDFLSDPFTFRRWGLEAQDHAFFAKNTTSPNYPGKRFKVNEEDQKVISNIIKKQFHGNITIASTDFMSFDFVDESYGQGIPHSDHLFAKFTLILFLHPNPPPHSGLELFDPWEKYLQKKLKPEGTVVSYGGNMIFGDTDWSQNLISSGNKKKKEFNTGSRNRLDRYFYKRVVQRVLDDQDNKIEISNKFNRLVLFPSNIIHRAQNYFGKENKDSRNIFIAFLGYIPHSMR